MSDNFNICIISVLVSASYLFPWVQIFLIFFIRWVILDYILNVCKVILRDSGSFWNPLRTRMFFFSHQLTCWWSGPMFFPTFWVPLVFKAFSVLFGNVLCVLPLVWPDWVLEGGFLVYWSRCFLLSRIPSTKVGGRRCAQVFISTFMGLLSLFPFSLWSLQYFLVSGGPPFGPLTRKMQLATLGCQRPMVGGQRQRKIRRFSPFAWDSNSSHLTHSSPLVFWLL